MKRSAWSIILVLLCGCSGATGVVPAECSDNANCSQETPLGAPSRPEAGDEPPVDPVQRNPAAREPANLSTSEESPTPTSTPPPLAAASTSADTGSVPPSPDSPMSPAILPAHSEVLDQPVPDTLVLDPIAFDSFGLDPFVVPALLDPAFFSDLLSFTVDDLVLDLISPLGPADTFTHLELLCRDSDLPDSFCRQRYGQ